MNQSYSLPGFFTLLKLDMWKSGHVEGAGWIEIINRKHDTPGHKNNEGRYDTGWYSCPDTGIYIIDIQTLQEPGNQLPAKYNLQLIVDSLHLPQVTAYVLNVICSSNEKWVMGLMGFSSDKPREYNTYQMARSTPYERFHQAAHSLFGMPVGQPRHKR